MVLVDRYAQALQAESASAVSAVLREVEEDFSPAALGPR